MADEQQNDPLRGVFDVEEVRAQYFNHTALREPPYRLLRVDPGRNLQGRWYGVVDNSGEDTPSVRGLYPSVTTVVDGTTPTSERLIQWRISQGERYWDVLNEKAEYGTMFHMLVAHLLLHEQIDISPSGIEELVLGSSRQWKFYTDAWLTRLASDLLCVWRWMSEWKIAPLAIEVGLAGSEQLPVAGTIDLVCAVTDPKTGLESYAVVDFKSGANFYPGHAVQLDFYRLLVEANFGYDRDLLRVFNVGPKDWRREPGYNIAEWSLQDAGALADGCLRWWSQFDLGTEQLKRKVRLFGGGMKGWDSPTMLHKNNGQVDLYSDTTIGEMILADLASNYLVPTEQHHDESI